MKLGLRSLDCEKARDMMFDYIDGELNENDIKLLEAHINECDSCRRELAERREVLALIKLAGDTPAPSLYDGVMERIADVPQEKKSIFARLRYLPAGTLVAACAVVMVLVVGRGYIFGGASMDVMVNDAAPECEVIVEGISPTEYSGSTDAVGGVVEDGEPVVYSALLDEAATQAADGGEPEYYSVTTASITADAPMMISAGGISDVEAVPADRAVVTKAMPKSELDVIFDFIDTEASAVIVCYDGILELDGIFTGEALTDENGTEYLLYTVTEDALSVYTEHLAALAASGAKYRASVSENDSVVRYDLYVVVNSEN